MNARARRYIPNRRIWGACQAISTKVNKLGIGCRLAAINVGPMNMMGLENNGASSEERPQGSHHHSILHPLTHVDVICANHTGSLFQPCPSVHLTFCKDPRTRGSPSPQPELPTFFPFFFKSSYLIHGQWIDKKSCGSCVCG